MKKPKSALPISSINSNVNINDIKDEILSTKNNIKGPFCINKPLVKPIIKDETKEINKLKNNDVNELFHKVNRMGPYYSHCLICSKKNAEFYNIMNPDNALKILGFINKDKKCKKEMFG